LPAPDIEIGLRHPVNCTLPRESAGVCDPVHNGHKKAAAGPVWGAANRRDRFAQRHKKVAAGPWEGINRVMDLVLPQLF
jgi:hypothetical protein